jgi:hypothetical protein
MEILFFGEESNFVDPPVDFSSIHSKKTGIEIPAPTRFRQVFERSEIAVPH